MTVSEVSFALKSGRTDNSARRMICRRVSHGGLLAAVVGILCAAGAGAQTAGTYVTTNILSDGSVQALATDPKFVNPWGLSIGRDFWVNAAATGLDYVALTTGAIPFKVVIPSASGKVTGSPTGTVFTGSTKAFLLANGSPANFLFSSLDGTISGWNAGVGFDGSVAQIVVNKGAAGAIYTDMALVTNTSGTFLLASNFGAAGSIDVFDGAYKPATLPGSFSDPNLPSGYGPFSVHSIGSQVIVTYAPRDTTGTAGTIYSPGSGPSYRQRVGAGNGIVDVFDTSGNFVARAVTGGNLNDPWGVAMASANFGVFSGDLLVGNFGDGVINVYDPKSFAYLGQVVDGKGGAMAFPGLWELVFGTAGYGDVNALYFTSGGASETHGVMGSITSSASSTGAAAFGFSASTPALAVAAGSPAQATISVVPTNNFSGMVTLTCSGLPSGTTCSFGTSTLPVTASSVATTTLTIQTTAHARLTPVEFVRRHGSGTALGVLLPFGSIWILRLRRLLRHYKGARLIVIALLSVAGIGLAAGCGSYMSPSMTTTTTNGTAQVVVTATAGSQSQTTGINLTIR